MAGDFFKFVPSGASAYILKSVIHDWDDKHALEILRHCRTAMTADARLLLVEAVVRRSNEPDPAKFTDLRMLVMNGGRARTETDFQQLYAAAGFRLSRIIPTASHFSLIEGTPV